MFRHYNSNEMWNNFDLRKMKIPKINNKYAEAYFSSKHPSINLSRHGKWTHNIIIITTPRDTSERTTWQGNETKFVTSQDYYIFPTVTICYDFYYVFIFICFSILWVSLTKDLEQCCRHLYSIYLCIRCIHCFCTCVRYLFFAHSSSNILFVFVVIDLGSSFVLVRHILVYTQVDGKLQNFFLRYGGEKGKQSMFMWSVYIDIDFGKIPTNKISLRVCYRYARTMISVFLFISFAFTHIDTNYQFS